MTYIPQETVFPEARATGEDMLGYLRACIIGPIIERVSLDDPDSDTFLGRYCSSHTLEYGYPYASPDFHIDQDSIRLHGLNVHLRYFQTDDCRLWKHPNTLRVGAVLASRRVDGTMYDRDAQLGQRDVQIGDIVIISSNTANIALTTQCLGVIGDTDGPLRVMMLSRNLPKMLQEAEDLEVKLCVHRDRVEIARKTEGNTNWRPRTDDLLIHREIRLCDREFMIDNVPDPLPIESAELHVEYNVIRSDMANRARELSEAKELCIIPGPLHPDNPLKWGVKCALDNSNGMPVRYVAVADPDRPASWDNALRRAGREGYGIVPLTRDPEVLELCRKYVDKRSAAEVGRECMLWRSIHVPSMIPVATCDNSVHRLHLMAKIKQNEGGDAIVSVQDGNAQFMSLDVKQGDLLRCDFVRTQDGDFHYKEFVVSAVLNEDAVVIQSGRGLKAEETPIRVEIWRVVREDSLVELICKDAESHMSERERAVWPDRVSSPEHTFEGWYLCAALAGLRSGCSPQQDLGGVEIAGITELDRSMEFTDDQRESMVNRGVWVVEERHGVACTKRAVSTATQDDPTAYDDALITTLDVVNKTLRDEVSEILGQAGATPGSREMLRARLQGRMNALAASGVPRLGKLLREGEVRLVRRHAFMANQVALSVRMTIPIPLGRSVDTDAIEVYQKIIA